MEPSGIVHQLGDDGSGGGLRISCSSNIDNKRREKCTLATMIHVLMETAPVETSQQKKKILCHKN